MAESLGNFINLGILRSKVLLQILAYWNLIPQNVDILLKIICYSKIIKCSDFTESTNHEFLISKIKSRQKLSSYAKSEIYHYPLSISNIEVGVYLITISIFRLQPWNPLGIEPRSTESVIWRFTTELHLHLGIRQWVKDEYG